MWVVWTESLDLAEGRRMLSWGRELLPSLRRPGPGDVSLVTPHHRLIVPIDCGRGPGWVCWILSSSRFYESWSFHFLSWPWRSNKDLIESEWRGLNSWLLARLEWERRRASGSFLMTTDALVSGLSQTAWHQLQSFLMVSMNRSRHSRDAAPDPDSRPFPQHFTLTRPNPPKKAWDSVQAARAGSGCRGRGLVYSHYPALTHGGKKQPDYASTGSANAEIICPTPLLLH